MSTSSAAHVAFAQRLAGPHAAILKWGAGERIVTAVGCRLCAVVMPRRAGSTTEALSEWAEHVDQEHPHLAETVRHGLEER